MEQVANLSDKRNGSKIKEFLRKDPHKLNVGEALVMTAATIFVTGVVTVSINTSIDLTHIVVKKLRSNDV